MVRRFKPALKTYQAAANALNVQAEDILMVAAHGWDILGAMKAGCQGALVARPGKAAFPLGPQPELACANFIELSSQIISKQQH